MSFPSDLDEALAAAMALPGALGAAVAQLDNGKCLARLGGDSLNLSTAATLNARLLRAKLDMIREMGQEEEIEDVLITLSGHYHLIRLIPGRDGIPYLFFYMILDRNQANLAIARRTLTIVARELSAKTDIRRFLEGNITVRTAAETPAPLFRLAASLENTTFSHGASALDSEDEIPAFMREESVMRMLGLTHTNGQAHRA